MAVTTKDSVFVTEKEKKGLYARAVIKGWADGSEQGTENQSASSEKGGAGPACYDTVPRNFLKGGQVCV